MANSTPLYQPTPRRKFELTPTSTESSAPPTPSRQRSDSSYLDPATREAHRTSSILNLTSSTLFGIYAPAGDENARVGVSTPWSTGAQTPVRLPNGDGSASPVMSSLANPKLQKLETAQKNSSSRDNNPPLFLRLVLLFCSGVVYGLIVRHLHDRQQWAPVKIDHFDRDSWRYLIQWGGVGVILGGLMPWVDIFWDETWGKSGNSDAAPSNPDSPISPISSIGEDGNSSFGSRNGWGGGWDIVVRAFGAFFGIAFAIVSRHSQSRELEISLTQLQRKLPWQSTLQVSLTVASLNPVLWYLIDRSKPGFYLSSFIGIIGTAVVLGVSPDLVPSPTSSLSNVSSNVTVDKAIFDGLIRNESIGVWTWIASVLFCSTLCFGNIGRRLSSGPSGRRASIL